MRKSVLIAVAFGLFAGAVIGVSVPGHPAGAQSSELYVNIVDLDINPADTTKFIELAKENGAAAVKEPGCREHNIVVSKTDPNHIVLFEIYDNEAALNAHRASDQFKRYQAATNGMVASRNAKAMSVIALNSKPH